MATSLSDINKSLKKQTAVLGAKQTYTSNRVDALKSSFDDFFKMIKEAAADDEKQDEENKREGAKDKSNSATQVSRAAQKGDKGLFGGLKSVFDVGNLLPYVSKLFSFLLNRVGPAFLGAVLADELGEAVKKLTGSEILGSVTEWGALGGAIGFLIGGPGGALKGGIIGAALGAIWNKETAEKIQGYYEDEFGKYIDDPKFATEMTQYAATAGALFLPALIPALLTKVLPFLFTPAGIIVMAIAAIGAGIIAYNTNDDFKKFVDDGWASLKNTINDIMKDINNWLSNRFADIKTYLIDAGKTILNNSGIGKTQITSTMVDEYASVNPEVASQISQKEARMAELAGQYKYIAGDNYIANKPEKIEFEKLRAELEALQNERRGYFDNIEKNKKLEQIKTGKRTPTPSEMMYGGQHGEFEGLTAKDVGIDYSSNLKESTGLGGNNAYDYMVGPDGEAAAVQVKADMSRAPMRQDLNNILRDQMIRQQGQLGAQLVSQTIDQSVTKAGDTNVMGLQLNSSDAADNIWGGATP